jgi:hypothetical protein
MSARRSMLAAFAAAVAISLLQQPAQAQLLDRIKKAAQKTTDAAKKAGAAEARAQFKSAVDDVAKEFVKDGSFIEVLSPWSSGDASTRTEVGRLSGTATATNTGSGYQILLCDVANAKPWSTSFTVLHNAPDAAAGSRTQTTQAASFAGTEYSLPTKLVTVDVVGAGVKTASGAEGSFKVASISQTIYAGVAKLKFARVMLPGDTTGEAVQVGAVFRARIQQPGEAPPSCGAKS